MCLYTQTKHMERFAIRAKYMTLEPRLNKYVHYFANIRTIQCHLVAEAAAAHVRTYIRHTHTRTHARTYIHTHVRTHARTRTRTRTRTHTLTMSLNGLQLPQVDNTNVDRSLALLHRTVFTFVRHLAYGPPTP
jgi:hypothetical protein